MQLTAKSLLLSTLLIASPLALAQTATTTVTKAAIPTCSKEGFTFSGNELVLNTGSDPLIQRIFIIKILPAIPY